MRAHKLILLSWQDDGRICERDLAAILAATDETATLAGESVTVLATVDHWIATGISLIHNGDSPRSRRLLGELGNVIAVDFQADGPEPDDSGAALAAA